MTVAAPLRQLLDIHIRDAFSLGLLGLTDHDEQAISGELDAFWTGAVEDLVAFYRGIERLSDYSGSMTWLQFIGVSEPVVHRVTTVADLKYALEGTQGAARRSLEEPRKKLLDLLSAIDTSNPVAGSEQYKEFGNQLRAICEDLRSHLCQLPRSRRPAMIKAASLHSEKTKAWVVPASGTDLDRCRDAQQIRDSLGLIHYPKREKPSCIAQSLVLMTFKASLSSSSLPEKCDPGFLLNSRKGQWLVRSTVCHGPNERFIQRHDGDTISGTPARHGRTIDISSDAYPYGFPELILLHGDNAELAWMDLKLLTPPPKNRDIDSDHLGYLRVVTERLRNPKP